MGFFDPPPPRPQPEPCVWREPRDWEPPNNILGQPVAVKAVLVHTDEIAISVVGVAAFPTGIRFKVLGLGRARPSSGERSVRNSPNPFYRPGLDVDDELRFGVLLSGSSKVTNQDEHPWPGETDPSANHRGRCCSSWEEAAQTERGASPTGCGHSLRRAISRSSANGPPWTSPNREPRSTPLPSVRLPRKRSRCGAPTSIRAERSRALTLRGVSRSAMAACARALGLRRLANGLKSTHPDGSGHRYRHPDAGIRPRSASAQPEAAFRILRMAYHRPIVGRCNRCGSNAPLRRTITDSRIPHDRGNHRTGRKYDRTATRHHASSDAQPADEVRNAGRYRRVRRGS